MLFEWKWRSWSMTGYSTITNVILKQSQSADRLSATFSPILCRPAVIVRAMLMFLSSVERFTHRTEFVELWTRRHPSTSNYIKILQLLSLFSWYGLWNSKVLCLFIQIWLIGICCNSNKYQYSSDGAVAEMWNICNLYADVFRSVNLNCIQIHIPFSTYGRSSIEK